MKKILLAEDDQFILRAYKDGLTNAGFDVTAVEDGQKALEALGKDTFNVLLLDIIMPNKDGFDVLEEFKMKEIEHPPVIILTNLGQESDIEKAKKLGAIDYLVKSDHSLAEVVSKVKEHAL